MLFGVFLVNCFVGLFVCWLVALLVFWFVGCLLVSCLAPVSQARHIFLFDGWMDGQIPKCIDTYMHSYTDLDGLFGVF